MKVAKAQGETSLRSQHIFHVLRRSNPIIGIKSNIIFTIILGLSWFLYSCSSDPFPGYTETKDHYFYKLHQFGDKGKKIQAGDMVVLDFMKRNKNGKSDTSGGAFGRVIFSARNDLPLMGDVLFALSEGDSATIIKPNDTAGKEIQTEVRIIKVQLKEEYDAEQKHIFEVGDIDEHKRLEEYLRKNKITTEPIENGLYMLPIKRGKGEDVKSGKTVQLSYKGYFLDGHEFDATKPNEPLEFVYGTEMQVIDGLRMALGRMREGEKSKIIIPSHFAFGEKGSSTGVVPPFTTLIYEVEIVKVK